MDPSILAPVATIAAAIITGIIVLYRQEIRTLMIWLFRKKRTDPYLGKGIDGVPLNANVIVIDSAHSGPHLITFNELCRQIRRTVIDPMTSADTKWIPDLVVCSGRGGAICGAIIASSLRNDDQRLPIRVVDIQYKLLEKDPDLEAIRPADVQRQKILIVESVRESPRVYVAILSRLKELNARAEIRDYVLVWAPDTEMHKAQYRPKYFSYLSDSVLPSRVRFPWYI